MKFLALAFSLLKTKKHMLLISGIILSTILLSTGIFFWVQTDFLSILNDYYLTAKESFLTPLGLSSFLYLAWAIVLFTVALKHVKLLIRHINIVLSSIVMLIASTGVLSFFEPWNGLLGYFTLGGEISLGGSLGSLLITENGWIGGSILGIIVIFALSLAFPFIAYRLSKFLYKFTVLSTFFAIESTKHINVYTKSAFKKMSRANFPYQNLIFQGRNSSQVKTSESNFELFEGATKSKNFDIFSRKLNPVVERIRNQPAPQTSSSKASNPFDGEMAKLKVPIEPSAVTLERFPSRKHQPEHIQSAQPKYNKFWNIGKRSDENIDSNSSTTTADLEFDYDNAPEETQNAETFSEDLETNTSESWDLPSINTLKIRS